jgi:rubrerythrin
MTNSDKNFINCKELFEMAIEMERNAAAFYRRLQVLATGKPESLELLKMLEKQEVEHEKILKNFDLAPYAKEMLQFPPDFSGSMKLSNPVNELSFEDILKLAEELEEKAANMYEHAASMTSGGLKDLLTGLANFEKNHSEKVKHLSYY